MTFQLENSDCSISPSVWEAKQQEASISENIEDEISKESVEGGKDREDNWESISIQSQSKSDLIVYKEVKYGIYGVWTIYYFREGKDNWRWRVE